MKLKKKTISKILIIISSLVALTLLIFVILSINFLAPVDKKSEEVIEFNVPTGMGKNQIADELEKAGLIKNALFFKFYVKFNSNKELYAGTYNISKSMSVDEIIDTLNKGKSLENEAITVQFIEGKRLADYAKKISENFPYTEEEIIEVSKDKEFLNKLIKNYWFVTEDILNDKIYYPLEGYLFPNTYTFLNKDVSVKTIIETMLDEMDKQLAKYKEELQDSEYSIHQLLTLASIVELEGARSDDRASVAGVFYNRIKSGWTLGSDVTTYYYLKIDDFKISLNGNANLYTCDYAYNTRCSSFTGLPVGPISNPGNDSIKSTIKYRVHNYYYFVADCNGKTYLSKNETEHYNTIEKLKRENNWCV